MEPPNHDYSVTPEAALAEANAILEAIDYALDGNEPSDFMLSFPIVRKAWDAVADKVHALAAAKTAVEKGNVEIQNAAFSKGPNSVVVRGFDGGIEISWTRNGVGFGALTLAATADGRLRADTETMSDKFCLEVLKQALAERDESGLR